MTMSPQENLEMAIETFKLEDLQSDTLRAHVNKVRLTGLGVCFKCRWQSGCLACDGEKAWRWAVSTELGFSGRGERKGKKGN